MHIETRYIQYAGREAGIIMYCWLQFTSNVRVRVRECMSMPSVCGLNFGWVMANVSRVDSFASWLCWNICHNQPKFKSRSLGILTQSRMHTFEVNCNRQYLREHVQALYVKKWPLCFRLRTVTRGVNRGAREELMYAMEQQIKRCDEPVEPLLRQFFKQEKLSLGGKYSL